MKKKNGFISTTMIFSFFIVFLATLLYIISNFSTTRSLSGALKEEIKSDISDINLARYIINNYEKINNENTLIINHSSILEGGAKDNSYRYVGKNPDNYVCLGTDEEICPDDNLYRIIGVIEGKVKLIKYTSYGNYAIDAPITGVEGTNIWLDTSIYKSLNEETIIEESPLVEENSESLSFLDSLGEYKGLISSTYWYYNGINSESLGSSAEQIYELELGEKSIIALAKVGLLYLSDYAYSIESRYWNTLINEYSLVTDYSWIYDSTNTWTMTRVNDLNNYHNNYYINATGNVEPGNTIQGNINETYSIRPVFYLKSITLKIDGNGTYETPYRVR